MPNHFETIPETNPNRHFPGGDADERSAMNASLLYCALTVGDTEARITKIKNLRVNETRHWRSLNRNNTVHGDLLNLVENWGHTILPDDGLGKSLATIGTLSTLAFISKSRLLPTGNLMPFSDTLLAMSTYGPEEIELFADEAWAGMHSAHPIIYDALAPWVGYIAQTFGIEDSEKQILLDASSALPYVMAAATRMHGYKGEGKRMDDNLARILPNEART